MQISEAKLMTKITFILATCACIATAPALADGDGSQITPEMVERDAANSSAGGGIMIPLILLALVAAAAAAN